MKFFIVTDLPKDEPYYRQFSNYALREDIELVDYNNVKSVLTKRLIERQEHVDCLILDIEQSVNLDNEDFVYNWITRKDDTICYSANNFRLNRIPIVFIYKSQYATLNGEVNHENLFNRTQILNGETVSLYNSTLSRILDEWLDCLETELDNLNLNLDFDFNKSKITEAKLADCKVLSEKFVKKKEALNYNWIGNKIEKLEMGFDKMENIIRAHQINPNYRNEKYIHNLMREHNGFLLGENFDRSYYEKQLYYRQSRRYVEVDFVNVLHNYFGGQLYLYEIKLPNHKFVSRRGLLLYNAKKYFNQIGLKYKQYFEELNHYKMIEKNFETSTKDFQLSLLMGRKADAEENSFMIDQALGKFSRKLNLITYDDLLNKYDFLFNRIKRFNIS